MVNSLSEQQLASGAVFAAALSTAPISFGNDDEAYQAARSGVAVCDRSHWGRLRVSDRDRLQFLHNQTTNQLQRLQPGQGCDTVFVTSTARTVDLVTAYVHQDAVLLLTSPGYAAVLSAWMDRYIFFADKVQLTDETDTSVAFTVLGPTSGQLLAQMGWAGEDAAVDASHRGVTIESHEVTIAVGSGLAIPGFTLMAPMAAGIDLWQGLAAAGAVPLGDRVWQQLRIEQGRPMPGAELTEDYNPLEAGLWHAVSFDKGCYIGQETIARLNTYQGVKQQLWGLQLSAMADPGTPIYVGEDKVGVLTSILATPMGIRGLGYIRTKAGGQGLSVMIGEAQAEVVAIPFATRGYLGA